MCSNVLKNKLSFWCVILFFSFIGNSIALSQNHNSNTSKIESDLKQTAEKMMESDLNSIHKILLSEGYNITSDLNISAIPSKTREEIVEIQKKMKYLIFATAKKIEDGHDFKIRIDEDGIGVTEDQNKQAGRISDAIKTTNISLSSYGIAVNYFIDMNKPLIDAANNEKDDRKKLKLFIKQAIYVYELSAVIIDMIENLSTQGIEDLRQIHKEESDDIANMKKNIKEMGDDPQSENWLKALDAVEVVWERVLLDVEGQEGNIEDFNAHKEKFENIKKRAAMQIKVLEKTQIAKGVFDSIAAIKTVIEIPDIILLRLGEEEIRTLIGSTLIGEGTRDKNVQLKQ